MKERISIWLDRWEFWLRYWVGRIVTGFRIRLGRVRGQYCPGCLGETVWADYQWGDGPKYRCLRGCSGEWYRLVGEEELREFKAKGLTKAPEFIRRSEAECL